MSVFVTELQVAERSFSKDEAIGVCVENGFIHG